MSAKGAIMAETGERVLGRVAALWRYPVKSMPGEQVQSAAITERGLLGDRAYAAVDLLTGKVASAKHPRKWARLLECRAAYLEPPALDAKLPPVQITLPDGLLVTSEDASIHQRLSEALGREVVLLSDTMEPASYEKYWLETEGMPYQDVVTEEPLVEMSNGSTFFDAAPLHLLASDALSRLHAHYPAGQFDARRFRPNIVLDLAPDVQEALETTWVDRALAIGDEVRLLIIAPCVRCVMTTLPQGDLPQDPGILRAVAQHSRAPFGPYGALPSVGIYAEVVSTGVIECGDPIRFI
jgi:uncharacterized protein YcbX